MLITTSLNEAIKDALIKYNQEILNGVISVYFRQGEAYLKTSSTELNEKKSVNKFIKLLKNASEIIDTLNGLNITVNYSGNNEDLTAGEYEEITTAIYNSLTGKNIKNDLTEILARYEVAEV